MFPGIWQVVIPAKELTVAKSRLNAPDLAQAFLADVLAAARGSKKIQRILLVTSDPQLAMLGTDFGAEVRADPGLGLISALETGLGHCDQDYGMAVILGDLPCVRPADLDLFLSHASHNPVSFLPDAEGTGSTMWARLPGESGLPMFGPRSRAAHVQSGAQEINDQALVRARRDVDTTVALWDAVRLGLGAHTTRQMQTSAIIRPR
jgi:2-phospho-L-lactate guanylyltransferase